MVALSFTDGFAHIIDGKKTSAPATHGIVNPATGEVFAHVPLASRAQLDEAVAAAERAFPAWSATTWEERQRVLEAVAGVLEEHAGHFVPLVMQEIGKDQMSAIFEVSLASRYLRAFARERLEDEIVSEDAQRVVKNRFRPYGVVGAYLLPFPLVLTTIKLGQALLAGNCLIIKSPPTAPCTVARFIEACQPFVPPGVLSVLHGDNEVGEWIVKDPRIPRVSVTGSTTAGKAVMRAAADELKSITLELGGNDPCIVLDDVEPQEMAQRILLGAVSNAGQTCFTMKRIYLHERVYDAVRDGLVALARETKIGNPFDPEVKLGPVQNAGQYERLRGLLADCKEKGYKIAYEGDTPSGKGYFIPLTIVDNPPDDARIVREEQFGPIVPLLKWNDDEDVIRRANDSVYGLGASIWGHDLARMERIGDKLCNGMVWMNEWGAVNGELPMQGMKHSGVGVESSKHGLAAWTIVQSVVRNNNL
ncbi:aldehyde dehydrogenase [Daedaleopsis nitida]|nr:aldehyde dehydrogenase [Daedaleopsis nitida]